MGSDELAEVARRFTPRSAPMPDAVLSHRPAQTIRVLMEAIGWCAWLQWLLLFKAPQQHYYHHHLDELDGALDDELNITQPHKLPFPLLVQNPMKTRSHHWILLNRSGTTSTAHQKVS